MRTSIRKLENMGLNEKQIIEVFGWDEESFEARKKYPHQSWNIEDLPQKIDLVVKGYTLADVKKIKLFDEIYEANDLAVPSQDAKYKIDMITEFPKLLKHIRMSRIKSEIEEIEDAKRNLLAQIAELDSQVSIKENEMTMLNASTKVELEEEPTEQEENAEPVEITKPVETTEKKTLTESDIRIDHVTKTGLNICVRNKELFDEVKLYDEIKLAREGKLELYKVKSYHDGQKRIVITFVETILENKSYDKEEEKARFRFW